MRKDFTAISAFSTLIALVAGAVICMQIANMKLTTVALPSPVVWALEAAIFGAALYVWRPGVSFLGWLVGIAGLIAVRVGLTSIAGLSLSVMRESANVGAMMKESAALSPRLCAVLFSLMVCYPLRTMVPLRREEGARRRRGFEGSRREVGDDADRGLLIVTVKDRGAGGGESWPKAHLRAPMVATTGTPMLEGEIHLPLSTVLALLPDNLVTDQALALSDSQTVMISLSAIHPQLKEAQVVFSVADLRSWLPPVVRKAIVQPSDSDLETENGLVSLPLELIVPQLPPAALQLLPPSPLAWCELQDTEKVVFARI